MADAGGVAPNLTATTLGGLLRRQWWVVVLVLVIAAAGGMLYVTHKKPSYTASAVVASGSSVFSTNVDTSATTVPTGPSPASEVDDPTVLEAAAKAADLPVGTVTLTASENASTITVTAVAPTDTQAVSAANAAATAFIHKHVADLNAQANALQPQVELLKQRLTTLERQNNNAAKVQADVVAGSYQAVVTQQEAFQLQAQSVSLSSRAASASPTSSKKRDLELSLALGLLGGCAIGLLRDRLNDKIRSSSEVGAEILVELPVGSPLRKTGTIADDPFGRLAEAVRELRTSLRFLSVEHPLRTVLVTSAAPGDGKSFVAMNLATAWAMAGVPTALVSSDLRRPSIETSLATMRTERGLSEVIADAAISARDEDETGEESHHFDFDEMLVPTEVDGLFVLPAGPLPPNPAELLGSPQMGRLLRELRRRVDVVILDSPPVLAVTDPVVLTAHCDGVVFVVSKNRTSRHAVRQGLRTIQGGLAPLAGVVMNRSSRPNAIGYYGQDVRSKGWRRRRKAAASA